MSQRFLPEYELRCIGAVKAVYTVRSGDTVLQ